MQQFLFDRDWQRRFPFLVASVKPKPQTNGRTKQPASNDTDHAHGTLPVSGISAARKESDR
jgi:hypothetical protein